MATMDSLWTIWRSFSCTSWQRNCHPKWEIVGTIITMKKPPTLYWSEKLHWRKNTHPSSSHAAVSISHRQEAYKQPIASKNSFTYSHISDYNVWVLRQKLQSLSMPKFQSIFSTKQSSVDQDKRTLHQLPTPWKLHWSTVQFVRRTTERATVFCIWKPITSQGQLQQHQ